MRPARYNGIVRKQGSFERRWEMKEEQSFTPGDVVEIIHGPFAKLTGKVRDINSDNRMLAVVVKIFGRDTTVELKFREVKKIAS
jgi:transcription antitermination factor NusG